MNMPVLSPEEQTRTIRELQDGLRILSGVNDAIPPSPADGIYSLDTKLAVKAFQKENGMEETGDADFTTWNAVMRQAEQAHISLEKASSLAVFEPPRLVIREGDSGDVVLCIQMMLRCIRPCLPHAEPVETDGSYGRQEAELVKKIQEAAGIDQTGCVDKFTWNILTVLYSRFSRPINDSDSYP